MMMELTQAEFLTKQLRYERERAEKQLIKLRTALHVIKTHESTSRYAKMVAEEALKDE
jgi:hypothetical protein